VTTEPVPERTLPDDTGRLSVDDLTGPGMRDLFRELDESYRAASAAFAANDMQAWVEHAGRGSELFEKFAQLNGWRNGERS
jgi:hypothetical protein